MSSMIHSARPIVTPVANIVFYCFVLLDLKSGDGHKDGRTTCAKTIIPTGRDFGLAEWINKTKVANDPLGHPHRHFTSKHYFLIKWFLLWIFESGEGRKDGRTDICVKILAVTEGVGLVDQFFFSWQHNNSTQCHNPKGLMLLREP